MKIGAFADSCAFEFTLGVAGLKIVNDGIYFSWGEEIIPNKVAPALE